MEVVSIKMPSKTELSKLHKEELLKIACDLTDKNKELTMQLAEKEAIIQENIVKYWSWEQITNEFDSIQHVGQALAFLNRILAEKAICANKSCPVFFTLLDIKKKKFILEQHFDSVYDEATAKIRFRTNKTKYNNWMKLYRAIRFMLSNAFHEITQIGIPNENKKNEIIDAHERENITVKNLGEARMMWQGSFAENVDHGLNRDRDIQQGKQKIEPLTPNHPEYKRKFGVFAKEQAALQEQAKKNKNKQVKH